MEISKVWAVEMGEFSERSAYAVPLIIVHAYYIYGEECGRMYGDARLFP